ncbi:unnamed protein product [Amoebophrya sp. A120]|nr:unnamed protein product [Amoebophrya sp. A120]|eukprot:GSA120T00016119001.1
MCYPKLDFAQQESNRIETAARPYLEDGHLLTAAQHAVGAGAGVKTMTEMQEPLQPRNSPPPADVAAPRRGGPATTKLRVLFALTGAAAVFPSASSSSVVPQKALLARQRTLSDGELSALSTSAGSVLSSPQQTLSTEGSLPSLAAGASRRGSKTHYSASPPGSTFGSPAQQFSNSPPQRFSGSSSLSPPWCKEHESSYSAAEFDELQAFRLEAGCDVGPGEEEKDDYSGRCNAAGQEPSAGGEEDTTTEQAASLSRCKSSFFFPSTPLEQPQPQRYSGIVPLLWRTFTPPPAHGSIDTSSGTSTSGSSSASAQSRASSTSSFPHGSEEDLQMTIRRAAAGEQLRNTFSTPSHSQSGTSISTGGSKRTARELAPPYPQTALTPPSLTLSGLKDKRVASCPGGLDCMETIDDVEERRFYRTNSEGRSTTPADVPSPATLPVLVFKRSSSVGSSPTLKPLSAPTIFYPQARRGEELQLSRSSTPAFGAGRSSCSSLKTSSGSDELGLHRNTSCGGLEDKEERRPPRQRAHSDPWSSLGRMPFAKPESGPDIEDANVDQQTLLTTSRAQLHDTHLRGNQTIPGVCGRPDRERLDHFYHGRKGTSSLGTSSKSSSSHLRVPNVSSCPAGLNCILEDVEASEEQKTPWELEQEARLAAEVTGRGKMVETGGATVDTAAPQMHENENKPVVPTGFASQLLRRIYRDACAVTRSKRGAALTVESVDIGSTGNKAAPNSSCPDVEAAAPAIFGNNSTRTQQGAPLSSPLHHAHSCPAMLNRIAEIDEEDECELTRAGEALPPQGRATGFLFAGGDDEHASPTQVFQSWPVDGEFQQDTADDDLLLDQELLGMLNGTASTSRGDSCTNSPTPFHNYTPQFYSLSRQSTEESQRSSSSSSGLLGRVKHVQSCPADLYRIVEDVEELEQDADFPHPGATGAYPQICQLESDATPIVEDARLRARLQQSGKSFLCSNFSPECGRDGYCYCREGADTGGEERMMLANDTSPASDHGVVKDVAEEDSSMLQARGEDAAGGADGEFDTPKPDEQADQVQELEKLRQTLSQRLSRGSMRSCLSYSGPSSPVLARQQSGGSDHGEIIGTTDGVLPTAAMSATTPSIALAEEISGDTSTFLHKSMSNVSSEFSFTRQSSHSEPTFSRQTSSGSGSFALNACSKRQVSTKSKAQSAPVSRQGSRQASKEACGRSRRYNLSTSQSGSSAIVVGQQGENSRTGTSTSTAIVPHQHNSGVSTTSRGLPFSGHKKFACAVGAAAVLGGLSRACVRQPNPQQKTSDGARASASAFVPIPGEKERSGKSVAVPKKQVDHGLGPVGERGPALADLSKIGLPVSQQPLEKDRACRTKLCGPVTKRGSRLKRENAKCSITSDTGLMIRATSGVLAGRLIRQAACVLASFGAGTVANEWFVAFLEALDDASTQQGTAISSSSSSGAAIVDAFAEQENGMKPKAAQTRPSPEQDETSTDEPASASSSQQQDQDLITAKKKFATSLQQPTTGGGPAQQQQFSSISSDPAAAPEFAPIEKITSSTSTVSDDLATALTNKLAKNAGDFQLQQVPDVNSGHSELCRILHDTCDMSDVWGTIEAGIAADQIFSRIVKPMLIAGHASKAMSQTVEIFTEGVSLYLVQNVVPLIQGAATGENPLSLDAITDVKAAASILFLAGVAGVTEVVVQEVLKKPIQTLELYEKRILRFLVKCRRRLGTTSTTATSSGGSSSSEEFNRDIWSKFFQELATERIEEIELHQLEDSEAGSLLEADGAFGMCEEDVASLEEYDELLGGFEQWSLFGNGARNESSEPVRSSP